jgi:tripartite-type tricarboxylate transporter receptor subunit TctC
VTTPSRVPFLPQTPTVAEAIPGSSFDVQTWYAVAGPAKLPRPIVDRLHAEIRKVIAEGEVRKRLDDLGMVAPADTTPEATLAIMKSYQERMSKLIKEAGIKPE